MNVDDAEPTWDPPYEDFRAEYEAQVAWLDAFPDKVPPWAVEDEASAGPTMPETAPERAEPPRMRSEPGAPAKPSPSAPVSVVAPLPPSPIGIGKRCRVLVGPPLYGGNRGQCRDGRVIGWDGVLEILLDGDERPKRYVEGRVSELHDYWPDMPLNPANVTWQWGDPTPQLAPPPPPATSGPSIAAEKEEGFNRTPETTALPPMPKAYEGILG